MKNGEESSKRECQKESIHERRMSKLWAEVEK